MATESAPNFRRVRNGYDPIAVDAFIALLTKTQDSLLDEVRMLQARLADATTEAAQLGKEVERLQATSPSAQAMTHRISKLLRTAVDEVSEMQTEARTEIEEWVAAAKAEADKLLSDAREDAAQYLANAKHATEVVADERISMLEQLMTVYKKLESVP